MPNYGKGASPRLIGEKKMHQKLQFLAGAIAGVIAYLKDYTFTDAIDVS